ncbi:MAG: hypothetical protein GTN81_14560 [Proteobacteria bacterium]|nr:hypothetical protein [Pseudomonadota bacterium]
MVKTKLIVAAVLAVIVGIWAISHFSESEEKRIKKRFDLLAQWVSKESAESAFTIAKKTRHIGTLFAEECRLKAEVALLSGTYAPEEISSYAAQARLQFSELSLRFYDLNIEFTQEDVAKVILTARLSGTSASGEAVNEIQELVSVLRKFDGEWLFTEFEVVEVLEK